jgi:hypothetical protein
MKIMKITKVESADNGFSREVGVGGVTKITKKNYDWIVVHYDNRYEFLSPKIPVILHVEDDVSNTNKSNKIQSKFNN